MKKILVVLLALVLIVGVAGCNLKPKAEDSLKVTLDAIQTADSEFFNEYIAVDLADDEKILEIAKSLCTSMTYEIVEVVEGDGVATASVTFTNIDMSIVIAKLMENFLVKAFEFQSLPLEEQPTEEELMVMVMDEMLALVKTETETVTNTASVSLIFVDGAWEIDESEDNTAFFDAMLGGLTSAASSIM